MFGCNPYVLFSHDRSHRNRPLIRCALRIHVGLNTAIFAFKSYEPSLSHQLNIAILNGNPPIDAHQCPLFGEAFFAVASRQSSEPASRSGTAGNWVRLHRGTQKRVAALSSYEYHLGGMQ